jgi:hypothetical protein
LADWPNIYGGLLDKKWLVFGNVDVAGFAVTTDSGLVSLGHIVMRFSPERAENRREFFRATARYGLLGLLTAAAGVAVRRQALPGQECVNRGICSSCGVFASCGLPQALSAKATLKG